MRWILCLWICCVSSGSVYGLTSLKQSCELQIEITPRMGPKKTIRFKARLKSKKQCQALAQIHQRHFDKNRMTSKKVTYQWNQKKKTIPTQF